MNYIYYSLLMVLPFFIPIELPEYIKIGNERTVEIGGDLANGRQMNDLSWAWNSSNACFPAIRQEKFSGNHVLYYTDLPSYSEMEITLIPNDRTSNMSLYAYEVGKVTPQNTVPSLTQCIRCESDFKWEFKRRGKTQDHTRKVRNIVALKNPYQVVIGVAGAEKLTNGGYKLKIEIKKR
ncbi:hypothetical protein [Membranihabitans maritimus]|uniref:hypothetical protein n=1 Tax=Membranihabitans maritimus TaxID=2904244 RepID=UPI001F37CFD8|nr:hypothetical protein [Membranihabitans maritimus]